MKNFILGIVTVLILGVVGFFAYQYGKKSVKTETTSITPSVSPQAASSTETPTLSAPLPTVKQINTNDNELIKQALFKKNNWPDNGTITVTVTTNDGKYASGTATSGGGGGYFYAVKDNGQWLIVADGNGVIECTKLANYPDYPKTLIPECWDQATQKNIKR